MPVLMCPYHLDRPAVLPTFGAGCSLCEYGEDSGPKRMEYTIFAQVCYDPMATMNARVWHSRDFETQAYTKEEARTKIVNLCRKMGWWLIIEEIIVGLPLK